jgi:hypothetical protein
MLPLSPLYLFLEDVRHLQKSCISILVLSDSDFSGEIFVECGGDTILKNKRHNQTRYKIRVWVQQEQGQGLFLASREKSVDMEIPPDSLEAGGVNELSVTADVDESVTTEQTA